MLSLNINREYETLNMHCSLAAEQSQQALNFFSKMYGVLIFLVCLSHAAMSTENATLKTPEYILPCHKADPDINKCLITTFNHLRPYLRDGIKEINVPSIDPLTIDNLIMENGRGPFKIRAGFYNISTNGASNYSVGSIKADVENYVIELGIQMPRLECKGKYDVSGNVLLFPVRSKGDFWAVFLDVHGAAKIYGKEFRNEENVRFMKVDKMMVDFKLKKSRFKIRDIINHGNVLGEAMNQFLNNNSDEIIAEMKPAAKEAIAEYFKEFLNKAFVQLPLKVWLPDA